MIQGILSICFDILEWLIGLFPSFEFVNNFVSSLNAVANILYEASPFVPIRDIFICVGLIFVILCVAFRYEMCELAHTSNTVY